MKFIEYCKLWLRVIRKKGFIYGDHSKPQKLGDKILLLGNGPSVKLFDEHRDFFADHDLLVVNLFPVKNPEFWTLKPRYLCLLDPKYVDPIGYVKNTKEVGYAEDCLALVDALEKVDWQLTIISYASRAFPYKNQNISYVRLSNARINWVDMDINKKLFFKNWAIPNAQGVIICALYFAEIFGFNEIGLLGVEESILNTLKVDSNNKMYRSTEYFYGNEKKYVPYTYELELATSLERFRGCRFAAEMAEGTNIKIINYTIDSYIQCFDKCDLSKMKL